MAGISRAALVSADSPYVTFSGWIRVPSENAYQNVPLFEFGSAPLDGNDATTPPSLIELWCGASSFQIGVTLYADSLWPSTPYTRHQGISTVTLPAAQFQFNKWYHLFLAADVSPDSVVNSGTITVVAYSKIASGVEQNGYLDHFIYPVTAGQVSWAWDYVERSPRLGDVWQAYSLTESGTHNLLISGKRLIIFVNGQHVMCSPDRSANDPIDQYEGFPDTSYNSYSPMPGYSLSSSGVEAAFPCRAVDYSARAKKFEAADFQLWCGKFLNPTVAGVLNPNFFVVNNGIATPANPATAAASFGMQTILLKGKASDGSFFINRGTGGAFVKVGTITDFTPTPSYA